MKQGLQKIQKAAEGLLYRSESEYPFEIIKYESLDSIIEEALLKVPPQDEKIHVEVITLEHFFRNMVKVCPNALPELQGVASKFQQLQKLLKEELQDVAVYKVGEVQVHAFIIGALPDGSYGGLRTKVVET